MVCFQRKLWETIQPNLLSISHTHTLNETHTLIKSFTVCSRHFDVIYLIYLLQNKPQTIRVHEFFLQNLRYEIFLPTNWMWYWWFRNSLQRFTFKKETATMTKFHKKYQKQGLCERNISKSFGTAYWQLIQSFSVGEISQHV